jgi:hypothetical protein
MTYIHTGLPILTKTAQRSLSVSAHKILEALIADKGEHYAIEDINDVLAQWLESSIEQLCEEACEMCVSGDRTHSSFNRSTFENLLKKAPCINIWEQEYSLVELHKDQQALALEHTAGSELVLSAAEVMDLEIAA